MSAVLEKGASVLPANWRDMLPTVEVLRRAEAALAVAVRHGLHEVTNAELQQILEAHNLVTVTRIAHEIGVAP